VLAATAAAAFLALNSSRQLLPKIVCEQELQTLYILYLTLATGLFLLCLGAVARVKIPTLGAGECGWLPISPRNTYTHQTLALFTSGGENGAAHTALCRFRLIASISPLCRPKVWSLGEY
jgi:hypothetical protein